MAKKISFFIFVKIRAVTSVSFFESVRKMKKKRTARKSARVSSEKWNVAGGKGGERVIKLA